MYWCQCGQCMCRNDWHSCIQAVHLHPHMPRRPPSRPKISSYGYHHPPTHMLPDITRSIPEQYELLKKFQDPIEFMLLYISVYEQQLRCSTKVFLHQIPYFAEFQVAFLDKTLELSMEGSAGLQSLDGLEGVLVSFRAKPFHDGEFYTCCAEMLFKGLNISVDRVQSEVLNGCYDNVAVLYKYFPYNIDVSGAIAHHIVEELEGAVDDEAASASLTALGPAVNRINRLIADIHLSSLLNFHREQCSDDPASVSTAFKNAECQERHGNASSPCLIKVGPSPLIVGSRRIEKYRIEGILGRVVKEYKAHLKVCVPETAYNQLMRLSKSVADIYGLEALSDEVKEYAKYLLVEDYTG